MTTTTTAKTRKTPDPWITEMITAPVYRWKLQIPRAVLAAQGHHAVAEILAAYGPHPVCLEQLSLGRCTFVILGSMSSASAAAGAIRSL